MVRVIIYLSHGGKPCPENGGSWLGDNGPMGEEEDDDDISKVNEEEESWMTFCLITWNAKPQPSTTLANWPG
jgi:hypothetical protein